MVGLVHYRILRSVLGSLGVHKISGMSFIGVCALSILRGGCISTRFLYASQAVAIRR